MKLDSIPEVRTNRIISELTAFAEGNRLQPLQINSSRRKNLMNWITHHVEYCRRLGWELDDHSIRLRWTRYSHDNGYTWMESVYWGRYGQIGAARLEPYAADFARIANRFAFRIYDRGSSVGFNWRLKPKTDAESG